MNQIRQWPVGSVHEQCIYQNYKVSKQPQLFFILLRNISLELWHLETMHGWQLHTKKGGRILLESVRICCADLHRSVHAHKAQLPYTHPTYP
jgi:hypothetical protein